MFNRRNVSLVLIVIFLIGAGLIIYRGRPVMKLNGENKESLFNEVGEGNENEGAQNQTPVNNTANQNPVSNTGANYSLADVAKHNNVNDCWSAVNGGVYDLTSWVSRHPGGPQAIMSMCGTDASSAFNGQHSGSRRAQAALVLLKIGNLN